MGSWLEPEYAPARKVNGVSRRLADISKARDVLGFETAVALEDGLRDLVSWWRAECAMRTEEAA
jgi:UDP-glucose 4-epimerase